MPTPERIVDFEALRRIVQKSFKYLPESRSGIARSGGAFMGDCARTYHVGASTEVHTRMHDRLRRRLKGARVRNTGSVPIPQGSVNACILASFTS